MCSTCVPEHFVIISLSLSLTHSFSAEKLLSAFTWHMSGININANTDIGRHISTLVRTLTTIGSDLEEADTQM